MMSFWTLGLTVVPEEWQTPELLLDTPTCPGSNPSPKQMYCAVYHCEKEGVLALVAEMSSMDLPAKFNALESRPITPFIYAENSSFILTQWEHYWSLTHKQIGYEKRMS